MKDFDRDARRTMSMVRRTQRLALLGSVVCGLVWLNCIGAVGYIAWHFLQRVW